MAFSQQSSNQQDRFPPVMTEDGPQTYSDPLAPRYYYEEPAGDPDRKGVVRYLVPDSDYTPRGMFEQDMSMPRIRSALHERLEKSSPVPIWTLPARDLSGPSRLTLVRSIGPDEPRFTAESRPRATISTYDDMAAGGWYDHDASYGATEFSTRRTGHASGGYGTVCPHPPERSSAADHPVGCNDIPPPSSWNPRQPSRQRQLSPARRPANDVNYVFERTSPSHGVLWADAGADPYRHRFRRTGTFLARPGGCVRSEIDHTHPKPQTPML